jgi:methyl-accepting chemotaxis protein
MLGLIRNAKTRTKLLLGFGTMMLFVGLIAGVGSWGLTTLHHSLGQLHDDHFEICVSLSDAASRMNAQRAHLLAMMQAKERAAQEKEHEAIRQASRECEATLDHLQKANLAPDTRTKLAAVRQSWDDYRKACDNELIPAVYAGRTQEALALATGVQRDHFRKSADGIRAIVNESRTQALRFKMEGDERYDTVRLYFLIICGAALAAGVILALVFNRMIAMPLVDMGNAIDRLSAGDLRVSVATESKDEVGQVAHAIRSMAERLRALMGHIDRSAAQVSAASQHLVGASQEMSAGTQEQAASLEETAASLEQITSSVKQSADMAKEASQVAAQSHEAADNGGKVVTQAIGAMTEIHQSSRRITDIIGTIDEIAFQTNLLALNAAVEAARAGEQGRGFAVVAGEVRNLAQRAAAAAKEIKALIHDSVKKVEDGSALVNRSGQALEGIAASVRRVTDLMAEIAATSQEQATGINQVNQAVAQMDSAVQRSAGQTEELSATAESMSQQAAELQRLIAQFQFDRESAPAVPAPVAARRATAPASAPRADRNDVVVSIAPVNGVDGFKEF